MQKYAFYSFSSLVTRGNVTDVNFFSTATTYFALCYPYFCQTFIRLHTSNSDMSSTLPSTHSVVVSLGSNVDAERNIDGALSRLRAILQGCKCSGRLWTVPVGAPKEAGAWPTKRFLNMILAATTPLTVADLQAELKLIERDLGRLDDEKRRGVVRIDIDLLAYDGQRFHEADWQRPYIKELLEDFSADSLVF